MSCENVWSEQEDESHKLPNNFSATRRDIVAVPEEKEQEGAKAIAGDSSAHKEFSAKPVSVNTPLASEAQHEAHSSGKRISSKQRGRKHSVGEPGEGQKR